MLFKDLGSEYIENIKLRDGWFMVKSIYLNHSNYNSKASPVSFFKEEVRLDLI